MSGPDDSLELVVTARAQKTKERTFMRSRPCISCEAGCTAATEGGCYGCEFKCQVDCQADCQVACQASCQFSCESTCQIYCESDCMLSCQSSCETREEACQYSCMTREEACQYSCMESCTFKSEDCIPSFEISAKISKPKKLGVAPIYEIISVDKWLDAIVVRGETALPVTGEIVEGKVTVETGKALFRSGTELTIITADSEKITGKLVLTAGVRIVTSVETSIEIVDLEGKTKILGGTLLAAEGDFLKDEGIIIRKGTKATILFGGKVHTGEVAEDTMIGTNKLYMRMRNSRIRRLTR